MKITVINGTEKRGVTYRLKEIFLAGFKGKADITEYYLPADGPDFCTGCTNCFFNGEHTCKDADKVRVIEKSLLEADLIVMTSPAYVMHATGAMKTLLDHFGYRWMPHRPAPEMFLKRAVIITQCLGAGAKSTAKDIKDSLSWWGISEISVFAGSLMGDIIWDKLSEKKRNELTRKVENLSKKFSHIDYAKPAHTNLITKIKFTVCRMMQKSLHKANPEYTDGKYWAAQGWLDKGRPWK
ncbi:MAG: NAD(P)H-dependent oxidoreductase [Lachnospiraceae bacterium]|nr:NAD(P)H-dependent oxidoreductase [Lachnospiraceae bacterium]